jgi:hypothetical protein
MSHVKTTDGYDVKVPSQGQVTLNSVLSALGTAGFVGLNLKDIVGGLFNRGAFNGMGLEAIMAMLIPMLTAMGCQRNEPTCNEDHLVNRYELELKQQLAAKDSEIALLKANTFTDGKTLELYRYIDGKFNAIESRLAAQDVRNQGVADAIREVSKDIDYKVNLEAERRCCADERLVGYMNGTFATKLIADYAAGTTTTAMETSNPLCCKC